MPIRIVTWNMQGGASGAKWTADVSRLFLQQDADIACLQECGNVPAGAQVTGSPSDTNGVSFTWNIAGSKTPFPVTILWLRTAAGKLALVIPSKTQYKPSIVKSGEFVALGASVQTAQGTPLNIYTSNTFLEAVPDSTVLLKQVGNQTQPGQAWFAVGDFNQEPTDWIWNPNLMPAGAVYCPHTSDSTIPGSITELDYGVLYVPSGGSSPTTTPPAGRVDMSFISSEHFPVFYDLPF